MLRKSDIVPALPAEGAKAGPEWFSKRFRDIGAHGAQQNGILWLQVNIWIRDVVRAAGVDTSNPVIRWLCFVIARGVCAGIRASQEEKST